MIGCHEVILFETVAVMYCCWYSCCCGVWYREKLSWHQHRTLLCIVVFPGSVLYSNISCLSVLYYPPPPLSSSFFSPSSFPHPCALLHSPISELASRRRVSMRLQPTVRMHCMPSTPRSGSPTSLSARSSEWPAAIPAEHYHKSLHLSCAVVK